MNVAPPSIRDDLGFSPSSLAWVVNGYLVTYGGLLLFCGRLGDLRGNRRVFLAGTALFTLASVTCGLATSAQVLVVGRVVQGCGGAAVTAVGLALIMGLFPGTAERAKAMGVFGFVMSGGGAVGVLLGGVSGLRPELFRLALDLPGQRADRYRRADHWSNPPSSGRRPAAEREGSLERQWCRARHRRTDARGVRRWSAATTPAGPPPARWRVLASAVAWLLVAFVVREARVDQPARAAAACSRSGTSRSLAGRGRAVGRRDVRLVLPDRALPPGGARARRPSRSGWPTCRLAW